MSVKLLLGLSRACHRKNVDRYLYRCLLYGNVASWTTLGDSNFDIRTFSFSCY